MYYTLAWIEIFFLRVPKLKCFLFCLLHSIANSQISFRALQTDCVCPPLFLPPASNFPVGYFR